jgi:dTDP-glucose 4,6-dehydratase
MRILVTGAGGFIGSHVTEALLRSNHSVRALVHYNSRGSWGHLNEVADDLRGQLEVKLGDVMDPFLVRNLVAGCDVVMHLAALIGIPYSYVAPASYVATNVTGALNILDACHQARTPRLVITSTSEVYGTARFTPITEDHPLQAQSPYSATKIAADKLAESYFRSFDLPVVILRPFNTYGPRQSARAVIPTILSQALSGLDEICLGGLEPERDLTFVEDTATAFLLAAEAPNIEGETIHFGRGEAVTIKELAQRCLSIVGSNARISIQAERKRPEKSEVGLLLCDPSKARKLLKWSPRVSLEDGLRRAADYIQRHKHKYRVGEYTT